MAVNEFKENRVAVADFVQVYNGATTALTSGVYIPVGAMVTGITYLQTGTHATNASMDQTFRACVNAVPLHAITTISVFPAQTIAYSRALLTNGMYLTTGGELRLECGSWSSSTSGSWAPRMYVGYVA